MKIQFNLELNKFEAIEVVTIGDMKVTMIGLGDTPEEAEEDLKNKIIEANAKA